MESAEVPRSFLYRFWDQSLHRNAVYLIANSVIAAGLGVLFWMLATRLYTQAEVGYASTIISSITLLVSLSSLGLGTALIRYLPSASKAKRKRMIDSCITITLLFSLLLSGVFILGLRIWAPGLMFLREDGMFILAFLLVVALRMLTSNFSTLFISARKSRFVFVTNSVLFGILKIPSLAFLVSLGALGIFYSWGIAAAIAVLLAAVFIIPKTNPGYKVRAKVSVRTVRSLFHFSMGNYVAGVLNLAPAVILPLMITSMLSADHTAIFYIAWLLASLLFMIPTNIAMSLFAEGSAEESKFRDNMKRATKFILLLCAPATVVLYFLGGELLSLFNEEYATDGFDILKVLALSIVPVIINTVYVTAKRIEEKVGVIIAIYGIVAIGTLAMSYFYLKEAGDDALVRIAYSWLISQCAAALVIPFDIALKRHSKRVKAREV